MSNTLRCTAFRPMLGVGGTTVGGIASFVVTGLDVIVRNVVMHRRGRFLWAQPPSPIEFADEEAKRRFSDAAVLAALAAYPNYPDAYANDEIGGTA